MFEAKFKLKHKGCWTIGLNKFKSGFVTHNTVSLNENYVQDITEVALANKRERERGEINRYFKSNKLIKKVEILQETENKLLIHDSEICDPSHNLLPRNILSNLRRVLLILTLKYLDLII